MGISGFPSGSINGFIAGVNSPNGQINLYLIGEPLDNACDGHGTCILPAIPAYTLPSSIYFV